MSGLVRRVAAVEAVQAAFQGRPLVFGETDCARLGAAVMMELGRESPLARVGRYRTAAGGLRAMRRAGHADLEAAVTAAGLERIGLASAWPADIIAFPADGGWGVSLGVHLGGGLALAFNPLSGVCEPGSAGVALFAWRV